MVQHTYSTRHKNQCAKVHNFSTWAGLPLNYTKCETTGILHATNPKNPTSKVQLEGQLKNKIPIGEAFAKYTPLQSHAEA